MPEVVLTGVYSIGIYASVRSPCGPKVSTVHHGSASISHM